MINDLENHNPETGERSDKPVRESIPSNDDRPRRSYGDRPSGGGDRPRRSYGDRPSGGDDRPRRSYGDRPSGGDDRPRRSYGDRPSGGDDRPRRSYGDRPSGGDDRPRRSYGDRPSGGDDRPRRSYGDRPSGGDDRPRRSYGDRPSGGGDRPRRSYGDRPSGGGDRPRRSYGDRPSGGGDRPRRSYGDRPSGGGDRPRRSYGDRPSGGGDRPRRSYGDRPSGSIEKADSDIVRLNKFIANSGICSRREADNYITTGLVSVNGVIITELGSKVNINDDVRFNGERLKGEKKVYLIMNKPKDFVTTLSDPHAEKTVMDLIAGKCKERVYPIGRLDKSTTGVLLFTNDGEMTEKLTHPSFQIKKVYHVFLDKNLKKPDFDALLSGIELEDGEIHVDAISYIDEDNSQVGIEIHSGRNRIVRRMFEHLGYDVNKLDRVYFAGLTKKNLSRGEWRYLTDTEIGMLRMGAFE